MSDADIVVTTALIPNRPAPELIKQEMVDAMRRGSVIVDLAAENGGNAACTQADKAVVTPNGVTCLGYTDLVSRLPTQATAAFGNNVAKFLLSIGPQTTGNKGEYYIDYEDDAVRGMLAVHSGELTYPAPPYNPPEVKPPPEAAPPPPPVPEWKKYASSAAKLTVLSALLTAMGMSGDPQFAVLLTTFALSGLAGWQAVAGVPPALHSPLMSVTNAISGLTAVGAMLLLPAQTFALKGATQLLAAGALLISAINIAGGFLVTKKMLDLFKRDSDPPEYYGFYGLPVRPPAPPPLASSRFARPTPHPRLTHSPLLSPTSGGRPARRSRAAHANGQDLGRLRRRPRLRDCVHLRDPRPRQAGVRTPRQHVLARGRHVRPRRHRRVPARRRRDDGGHVPARGARRRR